MTAGQRAWAVAAALSLVCAAVCAPAAAVDRTLGEAIPKPSASGAAWSPRAVRRLGRDLDAMLAGAPTVHGAHLGLLVLDSRSGASLYSRNADDAFMPASTMKLLTGSVALTNLTPAFRFRTRAYYDSGTLFIRGGGDPLLATGDLDALAASLYARGIVAIPRGIVVDAGDFDAARYPPGWSWDDFPYDYAPPISAATVDENALVLRVEPGVRPGTAASVVATGQSFAAAGVPLAGCPQRAGAMVRMLATTAERGAGASLDLHRGSDGCIEVIGSIAAQSEARTLAAAVTNPLVYLQLLARAACERAGIATAVAREPAARVPAGAPLVWSHDGEPLTDVLADLWWPSDNLVAELLLEAVGHQAHGIPGTAESGGSVERAWLTQIGIDPATLTIADGSGLSAYDRITPRALAAILQADWNGPYREIVLDDLPLAGVRGTLARSFGGSLAAGRTFAKTGTVNHTRGLAGYLATLRHGAVTFAWSLDDWLGSDADLAALRARVLSRIIGD